MTRSRAQESVRLREKVFTEEELVEGIEKLRARITQVEELKKDGLPYRDALRTTAEFQIRDTIREVFGEKSPQYHEHQHHKVQVNSKAEVNETIALLQDLIGILEHKLDVLHGKLPEAPPPPPAQAAGRASIRPAGAVASAPPPLTPPAQTSPAPPPRPPVAAPPQAATGPARKAAAVSTASEPKADGKPAPTAGRAPQKADAGKGAVLELIRKVCQRFHPVVRQLRQRSEDRPAFEVEDETDVRDLLRALLSMEFEDVSTEEWSPPYAPDATRSVILLKPEGIMIDVKKTRPGLGAKELMEQAMLDFEHYPGLHCRTVFCFVYDPEGRIPNPRRLESELTGRLHGRTAEVFVSPK